MTPDFEDKSCQMSFGLAPLPVEEDPAYQGSCLEECKMSGMFKPDPAQEKVCYVQRPSQDSGAGAAVVPAASASSDDSV